MVMPAGSLMISRGGFRGSAAGGCRGGIAVVAGQAHPERGGEGLGQDAQDDVEIDVEVDGAGQGVGAEPLDDLGEPLLDGNPPGVLAGQRLDSDVIVVGDDDGGASRPTPVTMSWRTVPG